MIRLYLVYLV